MPYTYPLATGGNAAPVVLIDPATGYAVTPGAGGGGNPSGDGAVNTGTASSVASSATDVTILAANTARYGASVFNDSSAILYLLVGAGTSSATNHTVQVAPGAYYEVPYGYTGILKGLWASATGSARVTEWT